MTPSGQGLSFMWGRGWAFWMLLGGSWALLIAQLGRYWLNDPQYGYGLAVPFLCGVLIWQRWEPRAASDELRELESDEKVSSVERGAWNGKVFFALLLLPLELIRQVTPEVRTIGIAGTVFCFFFTIWALKRVGERQILKTWGGFFLLFATAVPWPTFVEVPLVQGLMKGVADWSAEILNWFGVLAKAQGNLIELPNGMIRVDEACSGVRSLQSCLMASVALWQLLGLSGSQGLILVVLGQFLALAGNMVRALVLVGIAVKKGVESIYLFHDPAGWTILIGVILLLYGVARWLEARGSKQMTHDTTAMADPAASRLTAHGSRLTAPSLPDMRAPLFVAIFSFLAAHAWFWIHEWGHSPRERPYLHLTPGKEVSLQKKDVPLAILRTLQPQRGDYYLASSPGFGRAFIYDFFWTPSANTRIAFFHRPDVCMPGVGWKSVGKGHEVIIRLSGRDQRWYVFAFERGSQKILQAWSAWRDGVSQRLNFETSWKTIWRDQAQTWGLIRQGRRVASTEIASVVLETEPENESFLYSAIQDLFKIDKYDF